MIVILNLFNSLGSFRTVTYIDQSSNQLNNSLKRLSSGLCINSAQDNSSGFSISHSLDLNSKILEQAINNANDAIGMIALADKAIDEQIKIVELIKIKATQAAHDGQSQKTRNILQQEINLLLQSLDNISNSTSYNGISLLDGSFINKKFQIGSLSNTVVQTSINSTQSSYLGTTHFMTSANIVINGNFNMSIGSIHDKNKKYNIDFTIGHNTGEGIGELANEINKISDKTGVRADYEVSYKGNKNIEAGKTGEDFSINGVLIGSIEIQNNDKDGALVAAINSKTESTGVKAFLDQNGRLTLESIDGRGIKIQDSTNSFMNLAGLEGKTFVSAKTKDFKAVGEGGVKINGVDIESSATVEEFVDNINKTSEKSGVYATIEGDEYKIYSIDDSNGNIDINGNDAKNTGIKFTTFKGKETDSNSFIVRDAENPYIELAYTTNEGPTSLKIYIKKMLIINIMLKI